jgi:hypothetical protein
MLCWDDSSSSPIGLLLIGEALILSQVERITIIQKISFPHALVSPMFDLNELGGRRMGVAVRCRLLVASQYNPFSTTHATYERQQFR